MIRFAVILGLFFSIFAFGYQSIEMLNPKIQVAKSGWLKSDTDMSAAEAKTLFESGKFRALPKEAKSFGFDNHAYWYAFEVINSNHKIQNFIDNRDPVADRCELYVFQKNQLIRNEKSGYIVPLQQRPIHSLPIRFLLEDTNIPTLYLLKVNSQFPRYSSFDFGTHDEVEEMWRVQYVIFAFAVGVFTALSLYNLFLYMTTRDKAYIYYVLYLFAYGAIIAIVQGFMTLVSSVFVQYSGLCVALLLQIQFFGLTLFTEYFLRLKETDPPLQRKLRMIFYLNLAAALFVSTGISIANNISIALTLILYLTLLYAGFKSYTGGFKPAAYYLVATGVALVATIAYMFMHQGILISYDLWSANLMTFGIVWDMIFLSFALAYRIRVLQRDRDLAERMLQARSRFAILGETIGSIAHQWRQPLTELSSINTHIDAEIRFNGIIDKEKLQESLKESDKVIKHLSSIIDTFYGFFEKTSTTDTFELTSVINDVIDFMQGQFDANDIIVDFDDSKKLELTGNREEFFQALLNILSNSKDALIENNIDEPKFTIDLSVTATKATITIEDNGGGIKYEDTNQIFEPYESTKALHGMGIGLFITKTVIEKHMGGSITAENTKDGAMFVIVFDL